jgi:hypothetical protein
VQERGINSSNTSISVPMSELTKKPFFLEKDDKIIARASAKNEKGIGKWSEASKNDSLVRVPPKPTQTLALKSKTREEMII